MQQKRAELLVLLAIGFAIKLLYNRLQSAKSVPVSKKINPKKNVRPGSIPKGGRRTKPSSKPKRGAKGVVRGRASDVSATPEGRRRKVDGVAKPSRERTRPSLGKGKEAPSSESGRIFKDRDSRSISEASANIPTNIPTKVSFVEIDVNHDGQRLDNFLITHLKGVPKTHIYRIIRKGEIRVNKGRVKQTTRLKEGDSLRIPPIRLSERTLDSLDGQKYSFLGKAVLYEDDALLIINKPCGMAVHAGSGITVGVIEALRAYRQDLKYIELVHRLDRETSGVLVLAKKASALKILHNDFKTNSLKNPRLDKRYLTLVKGPWQHGQRRVTKALNTDSRRHGERYVVVDPNGRYASSIMTPKSVSDAASLIEVKLLTGRTHQVRVHAQSENHPVAGDPKYGEQEFNKRMKSMGLSRLFLHAAKLTFFHPLTEKSTTVEAPLPADLLAVLNKLSLEAS